ncbi:hypothetical protein GBA52_021545 [Prunus armeniaca]|nr:hypothetical protein GBA52_021545 [Prunus armeniaca]
MKLLFLSAMNSTPCKDKTAPTHNVNLSPFEGWMSAFYCMNKTVPVPCSPKGQLTFSGIVDVAPSEKGDYCSDKTGCSKHALGVLECIHLVKRDFWFHNNATVDVLNRTIIDGCANKDNNSGISTVSYTSSGMKMYIPYVASLSSLAFIAVSNIM